MGKHALFETGIHRPGSKEDGFFYRYLGREEPARVAGAAEESHPDCPRGGSKRNQCYLASGTKPRFDDGQWHTARIEQGANADGSQTIRAFGDGQLLARVRDSGHLNTNGHVSLYKRG
jgi:hypothetical protein